MYSTAFAAKKSFLNYNRKTSEVLTNLEQTKLGYHSGKRWVLEQLQNLNNDSWQVTIPLGTRMTLLCHP